MKRNERFGGQRNDRRPSHTSQEDSAERAMQWRNEIIKVSVHVAPKREGAHAVA